MTCDIETKRLIVDVQNDFCEGGTLAVQGANKCAEMISELVQKVHYDTIVATKDWHQPQHYSFASTYGKQPYTSVPPSPQNPQGDTLWPDHCVQGTYGSELCDKLKVKIDQTYLKGCKLSSGYSIGENDVFMSYIQKFDEVDVVGLAYDFCVKWSSIAIKNKLGKDKVVKILKKYVGSVNPANDDENTKFLTSHGVLIDSCTY